MTVKSYKTNLPEEAIIIQILQICSNAKYYLNKKLI